MKRNIALLLVVLMMFMMTGITSFADAHDIDKFTLYAGQDMPVGTVEVSNDGDNIDVKYVLNDDALENGWLISETHVHVGTTKGDFPLNDKGNPKVGLFDYTMEHDGVENYEYSIPMGDFKPGYDLMIAAHAVVERVEVTHEEDTSFTIVSNVDDTYYWNDLEEEWKNSVLSYVHSAWINEYGTSTPFGANWVWNSFKVTKPVIGETVEFKHDFTVDGKPNDASLTITTDNEYTASINTQLIGNDDNWKNAEVYPITVKNGENTLSFNAVNAPQENGTAESNPAGLAYKLEVEASKTIVDVEYAKESAWAEGTRFVDKGNWATYFDYTVHGEEYIETVTVSSETGVEVSSSQELVSGEEYRFVASGTFTYSSAEFNQADAEYFEKSSGWIKGESGPYLGIPYVIDVSVDGYDDNDDWGDYNPNHIYSMDYTGDGKEVKFLIWDSNYDDNEGSILIDIFKVW